MSNSSPKSFSSCSSEIEDDNNNGNELRRGPWTLEEDNLLIHSISTHGEGRWNLLASRSGLRRTGKSCRLRWLNYLKPDVKRGNLSAQEQLLILDLHSKWGNRWSKIAQHLPGRTDNEIKNYWRTRVQKQARHLNIDTNSEAFQQIIRSYWMPRLIQKINQSPPSELPITSPPEVLSQSSFAFEAPTAAPPPPAMTPLLIGGDLVGSSCNSSSSSSSQITQISGYQNYENFGSFLKDYCHDGHGGGEMMNWATTAVTGDSSYPVAHCHVAENNWMDSDFTGYMSNMDELWQF
ncbi:unnamed protein product [Citrullus colocynthis]|uniref:Uncharacterized protein n=1 Tax=Citrullus colocynthis TaxID=252529 RepID=A0ABP0XVH7_9ROSI